MTFRRKKAVDKGPRREVLQSELAKSRMELQDVKKQADEQAPLLGKLQKHLADNHFAARFVAAIDASRRRHA